MFDDSVKVGADVVLLYVCPQSCMPHHVKGLFEVYEDINGRGLAGACDVSNKGFLG